MKLEICAINIQSAIAAQDGGANRIELCDNIVEGGTTPSAGIIRIAKETLQIPINVLIRPRAGDFFYSDIDFQIMKEDIILCKELGVNGVVIGLLNTDGTVDVIRTRQLVELAKPMEVTFHRAFDMTSDAVQALEDVISIGGVSRILTSGNSNSALQGLKFIKKLVQQAKGRVLIMPGSGVNSSNLESFFEVNGIDEIHLSAKEKVKTKMKFLPTDISMSGGDFAKDDYFYASNVSIVKEIANKLKE